MNTQRSLRRVAWKVIIESLLDYAKAHKTLTSPTSTERDRARAAGVQSEVEEFFANRHEDPWFELSECNLEWLYGCFRSFTADATRMSMVAKMRFSDSEQ